MSKKTVSQPPYDVKAMVQSLLAPFHGDQTWFDEQWKRFGHHDTATWLCEFKTVGLFVPRQTGRTRALAQIFNLVGEALYVVPNLNIKRMLIENCANQNPDFIGYPRTAIDRRRVLTPYEIKRSVLHRKKGEEDPIPSAKLIIVDDASYFFGNMKYTQFYEWLAERGGPDQVILRVN
jgi:hypothetical protein